VLATAGVAATAGLTALAARALGLHWREALLLGAIVSSTDAATVFAVLRGSRLSLKPRIGSVLELESSLNDPMAVILTIALTQVFAAGAAAPGALALAAQVLVQLAVGAAAGLAIGWVVRQLLVRVRLGTSGLYPVLTLAAALASFGGATLVQGSGFLAAYLTGLVIGNGKLPYRGGLTRVHDAVGWLSQIGMFLMLGLLVFPSRLPAVAGIGILLALFLAFVARPAAVALCIWPFGYRPREIAFLGWVGLRGSVPIILASYPVFSGVAGATRVFDIVFFIVVVSVFVPGATLRWLTRRWGFRTDERPTPAAALEINSMQPLTGDLVSFHIDPTLAVCGARLSQIPFPDGCAAVLLVRGADIQACRGDTELRTGDHVYIFCRDTDKPLLQLLFGKPEEGTS
jgi:cell volume regulation protein A